MLRTSNNVKLIIASTVSSVDTTVNVVSAVGLPDVSDPADWTIVTLVRNSDERYEIVRVNEITGNVLTVVRAQESTTALDLSSGDSVRNYFTAGMFDQFSFEADAAEASEAAAAASAAAALASENAASTSETNAATSETNAATSASNAATSETNAAASESAASTSATNASNSAAAASVSETNAAASAAAAAADANNTLQTTSATVDNTLMKADGVDKDMQNTGIVVDDSDRVEGILSLGLDEEASTPSTPATGKHKLYFKTDNKLYSLDDAGLEQEVGAGQGGDIFGETTEYTHADTETILASEWDESGSGAGSCSVTNKYSAATDGTVNITDSTNLTAGDKCILKVTGAGRCTWTFTNSSDKFNYNSNITELHQSAGDTKITVIYVGGNDFEVQ